MTPDLHALHPRHPSLYRLAGDGRSLDFLFARCPHCQGLSFPANAPGCMHCGQPTEGAETVALPGGGTLMECVTVHVPLFPGMVAPCVVADIRIAPQVVEEGVIAVDDESRLAPGATLKAIAVADMAAEVFDCRFVPADAEAAS